MVLRWPFLTSLISIKSMFIKVAGSVKVSGTRCSWWLNWRPCSGRESIGHRREPKQRVGSWQQGAGQPARAELATSQPLGQTTARSFPVVLTFLLHIEIAFHRPLTWGSVILVGWFHSLHESLHFLPSAFKVIPSLIPRTGNKQNPTLPHTSTKIIMSN